MVKIASGRASRKAIVRKLRRNIMERERPKTIVSMPSMQGVQIPVQTIPCMPAPSMKMEKEPEPIEGIAIEGELGRRIKPPRIDEGKEELRNISLVYPIIPRNVEKGKPVFAYVNIKWNSKINNLFYNLVEPPLTTQDQELISKIKAELEERLDIDVSRMGMVQVRELLRQEILSSISKYAPNISREKTESLVYYIERDTVGLGKIEALLQDPHVEDISADGVGIPLYIYHRDPKINSVRTNVMFDSPKELDDFVNRLAQLCNKTINIAEPLIDGTLPDGSRVQATLGTDIARYGSNFSIRKFTELPLTPSHMVGFKTMDALQLAYLWMAVEWGQTILVSGGTGTGKTSLLNALSLFIKPSMKVVSIEDTSELRLPLLHWVPHVARSALAVKGRKKIGEVTLFDLLKASLRQRPDYIIVGEVRGEEAFVLFQQIATGHAGMATIHAATVPQLVDRLTTPPINLPPSLLENIDIIVFLTVSKIGGASVRRTESILEVTGIKRDRPMTRKLFEWNPMGDNFEITSTSVVLKKIARKAGLTEDSVKEELLRRRAVIQWMANNNITDYREVGKIISSYYSQPDRVIDMVSA